MASKKKVKAPTPANGKPWDPKSWLTEEEILWVKAHAAADPLPKPAQAEQPETPPGGGQGDGSGGGGSNKP